MAKASAKDGRKSAGKKSAKLEHELYKTEEGRKQLAEITANTIKEKHLIEAQNSKLNALKLETRWREIMREAKSEELLLEIQRLQQEHTRRVDRKNATIEELIHDFDESENQFQVAIQCHLANVDDFSNLQRKRNENLWAVFEADVAQLEADFKSENMKLEAQHQKEKSNLGGILTRMHDEFQDTEVDAKHEFQSNEDDVKNKNLEEKHALRIQLEATIEDLWRQFQMALKNYNDSTEERKKAFEELKARDQNSAQQIEQQMKKLIKLQESIGQVKQKTLSIARDFEEKNRLLRQEKESVQYKYQQLKQRMNQFREGERKKLTQLSVASERVTKKLEQRVTMAEKLLKIAEMNSKLELEKEKILPFYPDTQMSEELEIVNVDNKNKEYTLHQSTTTNGISAEISVLKDHKNKQSKDDNSTPTFDLTLSNDESLAMQQFYKRYNTVRLNTLQLEDQKSLLQEENSSLKSLLKQYLEGISVNEQVLNKVNPLFVVNSRTNAPIETRRVGTISYVEGGSHLHQLRGHG